MTATGSGGGTLEVDAVAEITEAYPGNNWRFAAGTSEAWLEAVYIDNGDGLTLKDSEGDTVPEAKRSHLLTCWRHLHVEVDSMGAPEDNQPPEGAHIFGSVEGESDKLSHTDLEDAEAEFTPGEQLVGSTVDPDIDDQDTEPYVVTQGGECSVTCAGATMLDHADTGDTYEIDTDDVYPDDVDTPDTALLAAAFAPASITVKFDTGEETDDVPFARHGLGPESRGILPERDNYWCVYICSAYQHISKIMDDDPETEDAWLGWCYDERGGLGNPGHSYVFLEALRDGCHDQGWSTSTVERQTVLHELGHDFDMDHCPPATRCIMVESSDPADNDQSFCPACIARIRHVGTGDPGGKHP